MFDTSSLVDLLIDHADHVDLAFDAYILDLTTYEVTNVLWKIAGRGDDFSRGEINDLFIFFEKTREHMSVVDYKNVDMGRVLDIARDKDLTVYDATYLLAASSRGATFITEDAALREAAPDDLNTATLAAILPY